MLLAACADRVAATLDGVSVPTGAQLDAAMNPAHPRETSGGRGYRQLLVLAGHLAGRGGRLAEEELIAGLAQLPEPPAGHGGEGSDAVVRAAAVGLLPASLDTIAGVAARSAAATGASAQVRAASAVGACAVAMALREMPNPAATPEKMLAALTARCADSELARLLAVTRTLIRHRAGPAEAIATLAGAPSALRVVPAALTAYLRHPADPAAAIRYAVAVGGQTRALGVVAAAMAGARNPAYRPPQAWRQQGDAPAIHAIAQALAALARPALASPPVTRGVGNL